MQDLRADAAAIIIRPGLAAGWEFVSGTPGNTGNISLGIAAGMFGYLAPNGQIPSNMEGHHHLREEFCDPTKK